MEAPNRIRAFREARNLSLTELGDLVGLSFGQVSKIEKGNRGLTVEWLQRFARAFDCCAADLLPPPAKDVYVDRPPSEPTTTTGFEWATAAGLHAEEQWPVRLRDRGTGYSAHGCAWFGADFLQRFNIRPDACEVVQARDSSMEPALPRGSVCLIDRRRTDFISGALYALERGNEPLIRRAMPDGEGYVFMAEDSTFPRIRLGNEYAMVGRALWTARMLEAGTAATSSGASRVVTAA